jgi:uncharacterized protein (TIGR03437 family)
MKAAILFLSLLAVYAPGSFRAQSPEEYRGIWVDTFNTPLNNHEDVLAVVRSVQLAHCNAIFAQARRRGDSWYLNSLEPPADRTPIAPGFDPLADLIREAHMVGVEVHAFVIIGALWNNDPATRVPENPNHVFNKHGVNPATGKVFEGRDNWLTRTLLPDGGGVSYGGYRIGAAANTGDFWIDLGHPDASEHVLRTLIHLIRNYDLDGLHLDRIRYPDIPGPQTGGVSSGYNQTSIARFHKRYGNPPESGPPAPTDPRWGQWRREQVTDFVRRIYLNAVAVKPKLKISAALIAYGSAPASDAEWKNAETYFRVYQDWRAWIEEGILDYAILMNYKREYLPLQRAQYESWVEWAKTHAYDRGVIIGEGVYLNSIEGTLRQTRKALAPSSSGARVQGAAFFSYAVTNEALPSNPHSIPSGRRTPRRSFLEFASALTTGKSIDGAVYEDPAVGQAVFAAKADIPAASWKSAPMVGHLMGTVRTRDGVGVDSSDIRISRVSDGTSPAKGRTNLLTHTDGNGFYGGVDLAPGNYRVTVTPLGEQTRGVNCTVLVSIGRVSVFDLIVDQSLLVAASSVEGGACGPETSAAPLASAPTSPISIFTANGDDAGVPAALFLKIRADGGRTIEPVAEYQGAQNKYLLRALDLGMETDRSFLILFGSGLRDRQKQASIQARIGGAPADVLFAGEQGTVAGLDQMTIKLPNSLRGRGEVEVVLYAGSAVAKIVRIRLK